MTAVTEPLPVDVLAKALIETALGWAASHLYVEQQATRCRISARLPDNTIRELDMIPQDEGQTLVDHFKGLASLNVQDRRTPQYGCLPVGLSGGERSLRVGSLPLMDAQQRQRVVVWLTTAPPCSSEAVMC